MISVYYKIIDITTEDIYYLPVDSISYQISFVYDPNTNIINSAILSIITQSGKLIPVQKKELQSDIEIVSFNAELFVNKYIRTLETYTLDPVSIV